MVREDSIEAWIRAIRKSVVKMPWFEIQATIKALLTISTDSRAKAGNLTE